MKLIDLLVKIANKEEVPRFIYEGRRYEYNKNYEWFDDLDDVSRCKDVIFPLELNDEIETIEDTPKDKKIEKLDLEDDGNTITLFGEKENEWTILDNVDIIVCNKINEIIDKINNQE